MKYFLLTALLVLAYAIFSYGVIIYKGRHSQNPNIVQKDTEFGQGPVLRYIAAGDSTAVGRGASNVENTYTYKIATRLAQDRRVVYRNVAVSGAKTTDIIESQLDKIIAFNPDVVTISIGANDQTHLRSNATILRNYKTIMQKLTDETRAQIYITDIPNFTGAKLLPWLYIKILEMKSGTLNPKIMALENDRVKIIDIHNFGWDNFPKRRPSYSSDDFHPSDASYENWTVAFLDKIQ